MLLLTAAVIFAGCSQSDNTTSAAPITTPDRPGDPYIVYQRSGGLSNMGDTLSIYEGGDCELVGKNGDLHRCQVLSLKLGKIEQAFEQAGFFALPEEYPGNSQADVIKYCINYSAEGKKHRVTVYSNAMPDPLIPLIRELDQCIMLVSIAGVISQP
ncbi:MAG: protealysin inhibitor emfourin [Dehalococcoidia bacterium]